MWPRRVVVSDSSDPRRRRRANASKLIALDMWALALFSAALIAAVTGIFTDAIYKSNETGESFGLLFYCASAHSCVPIDATCNANTTSLLADDSCTIFQGARIIAILALVTSVAATVAHIISTFGGKKDYAWTGLFSAITFILMGTVVASLAFLFHESNNLNMTLPDTKYGFSFNALVVMFVFTVLSFVFTLITPVYRSRQRRRRRMEALPAPRQPAVFV
eukprot:Clim_evm10s202 gene=Clim_evmTU10s202